MKGRKWDKFVRWTVKGRKWGRKRGKSGNKGGGGG